MIKCLIIDKIHDHILSILKEEKIDVDYQPEISRAEIIQNIGNYDAIVVRGKTVIDREIIDKATKLKIVARAGAGLDILDVDYLKKKNIAVVNSPEANRDIVGDQTVGMILSLLNNLNLADRQVRNRQWFRESNRGYELEGKVVGIVGFGNMGRAFARRLTGFNCQILVYDKYKSGFGVDYIEESSMERIFEESDILSLHLPLTDDTMGLVNEEYLSKFKKNIMLINTARGKIAPMEPIVKGLKSGKLVGAGLDVLECEDFSKFTPVQEECFNFLAESKNTLLTPHIGGWSFESYEKISIVLGEKIVRFFE